MPSPTRQYRHFTGLAGSTSSTLVRFATYQNRTHLVVPVIALCGNIVIRPMNSLGPEFVPAEILDDLPPSTWNGRPVITDHPNDGRDSANHPATLESMCFGTMFDTRVEDGKLKCNAWLDVEKAEGLGINGDAATVVARCQAGETVEVSVGAWVSLEKVDGEWEGEPYEYIWRGVIGDHLAMLPVGVEGACSVSKGGCGAPRLLANSTPKIFDNLVKDKAADNPDTDAPANQDRVEEDVVKHGVSPSPVWVREDSNLRPAGYEPDALTAELRTRDDVVVDLDRRLMELPPVVEPDPSTQQRTETDPKKVAECKLHDGLSPEMPPVVAPAGGPEDDARIAAIGGIPGTVCDKGNSTTTSAALSSTSPASRTRDDNLNGRGWTPGLPPTFTGSPAGVASGSGSSAESSMPPRHEKKTSIGRTDLSSTNSASPRSYVLRAAAMSEARRPTYGGTESTPWSAPSFSDWVSALYDGDSPPTSVAACTSSLKRAIASRTLLGDARSTTFSDLAMFPVVRPSNDRLNEKALRGVLTRVQGSNSSLDLATRKSCAEMCVRLLNMEFGAEIDLDKILADITEVKMEGATSTDNLPRMKKGFFAALRDFFLPRTNQGPTDVELRQALWDALRETEPGFYDIGQVRPDPGNVVYFCYRQDSYDDVAYRRSFTIGEDGTSITFADDRVEVEFVGDWEPVAAMSGRVETAETKPDCQCGKHVSANASTSTAEPVTISGENQLGDIENASTNLETTDSDSKGETTMADVPKTPETPNTPVETPPSTPPATPANPESPKALSTQEWLAAAPPEARALFDRVQRQETQRKEALIASLSTAQKVYTKDDLSAKPIDELEKLYTLTNNGASAADDLPYDFSGRGLAVSPDADVSKTRDMYLNPPDGWGIKKSRAVARGNAADTTATTATAN